MTDTLVVSEVFGPTIQGEGPSTGRRCAFIRLMACNLHCSWCDTPYTWDATRFDLRAEGQRRPVSDIADQVEAMNVPLVVVSGGEPLLNQRRPAWPVLLERLSRHAEVEVETNGTIAPTERSALVTRFNVSPKLAHAGDPETARVRRDALATFTELARDGRACFKFVAAGPGDITEIEGWCSDYGLPRHTVWVMPLGTTPEQIMACSRSLADPAIHAGFNVTTRLHTLLWGAERGR